MEIVCIVERSDVLEKWSQFFYSPIVSNEKTQCVCVCGGGIL